MPDYHVSQEKVRKLVSELRSWEDGDPQPTLNELATKYDLDIFVVDRIARSEGFRLRATHTVESDRERPQESDPNASTLDLDPDAIQEALEEPETDPNYEDKDTGVWKKNPTGEWELVSDKKKS